MPVNHFATGYVRLLYRFARVEGLTEGELLIDTGCTEADLMRADFQMPFAAQMCLTHNALVHATQGLGLRVGNQLQLAAHGALGTAMQTAPDLKTALSTFAQFVGMRASFFSVSLFEEGGEGCISIDTGELPELLVAFFSESILFALTHCLAFFTGQREAVTRIQLAYNKPEYGSEYAAVFGDTITFAHGRTRLFFDRTFLESPSPEADADTFADSVRRCKLQLEQHQQHPDLVHSIESFLYENPGKLWTVEEIAPLFALSPRTLLRQLKSRGTTYQSLRDDALKHQALNYLSSMSVEAAAISLGFADSSSFRRTFKRWFGVPPSDYRARPSGVGSSLPIQTRLVARLP